MPVRFKTFARVASASLALAVLASCGGGSDDDAVRVKSITVFGDSLSDVGTYAPATGRPDNPGKFTVNPTPVWVESVAAHYGLTLSPNRALTLDATASGIASAGVGTARVLGGNGYAEGGARVARFPSQSGVGNNDVVAPVAQQVERYLSQHGRFAADQLVVIDGGSNDLYAQLSDLCWGTDSNGRGAAAPTQAAADAAVDEAANALVSAVKRIKDQGGGPVLVAGAFDFTVTPFGAAFMKPLDLAACTVPQAPAVVTNWATRFNRIVAEGTQGLPDVQYLDLTDTLARVLAKPGDFGIENTADMACNNTEPTRSAVFCTAQTLVKPNAGDTYMWSDNFHPSPRLHRVMADEAIKAARAIAQPQ
ncbi:hypothetical protein FVQ98_02460 [Ottowia sp. GY511]|uniref:SGNH/GDSL hydrolase family protein n=1 Tax=Ottowia flava TaxID=2675430 RepID=A0ABW4KRH8_9BURK|nr:SGNH/GDSL hydrolase family protein [Ottowia sp. GY511]TXK32871.1 hypothetical protein FVQ98_02460 [Ottowia sp. GY511]